MTGVSERMADAVWQDDERESTGALRQAIGGAVIILATLAGALVISLSSPSCDELVHEVLSGERPESTLPDRCWN